MNINPVVWFEIYVQDIARATKFYESVLDTKLDKLGDPTDSNVQMMAFPMGMDHPGAAGTLVQMDGFTSGGSGTLVYFGCDDCAVEAARVASSGGHVEREKTSLGEYGFIALAADTEGNMFGLHSTK
ncbi:MAG: VOC family protein [Rhodanobacter sp.]